VRKVQRMTVPLSVLELCPVEQGTSARQALQNATRIAVAVEALGFSRLWIAEHHNMLSIASAAPEVLIAHIASATRRLRVGAGGIMLPNHAPLHVVEVFRTLEALYPGRIDLGVGRAPGTDQLASAALRRTGNGPGEVDELVDEFFAFALHEFPAQHPFARIATVPADVDMPPVWMLGSSGEGARIAASRGLLYAFAGHFSMAQARGALSHYHQHFQPSARLAAPHAMLAVTAVCGENQEHARALAMPLRVSVARMASGKTAPLPSPASAMDYVFTPEEQRFVDRFFEGALIGDATQVASGLRKIANETGVAELMLSTMIADPDERIASYTRIAQAMGQAPMVQPSPGQADFPHAATAM
jgi:luciferase family oxidoreductase group 1